MINKVYNLIYKNIFAFQQSSVNVLGQRKMLKDIAMNWSQIIQ